MTAAVAGERDQGPGLVDAHAHLDLLGDALAAVTEATAAGVDRILTVGTDLASSRLAVELSLQFPQVLACIGIHPHGARSVDESAITELDRLAASPMVVAIGETGLDFYRELAPPRQQADAFRRHIELARKNCLPLVVHTRQAASQTLEILASEAAGLTVVLHCFSLYEHVQECANRGYYMSVAGNVTYKNAGQLRLSAREIPLPFILTETDCPYLTPVPHRGKTNRPEFVRFTAAEIARLRGLSCEDLAAQILANFNSAFKCLPR